VILLLKAERHVAAHRRGDTWVREYLRGAARFSAQRHAGQTRKNGKTPYISHPVTVTNILAREGGVEDHEVLAASLLHDTIEDTDTTHRELVERFGRRVADMVLELSNPPGLDGDEARAFQLTKEYSPGAATVKIADKTANVRDVANDPPPHWTRAKRRRYVEHADTLVQRIGDAHPVLRAVFEATRDDALKKIS
jgi:(p)ppGpp synthase/HD superfamily hydrolase